MPAAQWPLQNDRPMIEIVLSAKAGQNLVCCLVADTGAGTRQSVYQFILAENDCTQCGAILVGHVKLGGAYSGSFPVYLVQIAIPQLNFNEPVPAVGVSQFPPGF